MPIHAGSGIVSANFSPPAILRERLYVLTEPPASSRIGNQSQDGGVIGVKEECECDC